MPTEPRPAWAVKIEKDFDLPPEQQAILDEAVEAYHRLQQIKAALDKETSLLVAGRGGPPKVAPLLAAERAQRDAYIRAIRALNLA